MTRLLDYYQGVIKLKIMPKIMIIDDTVENLKLLEKLMISEEYNVFCFTRGDLAIKSALHNKPDLILLDINMPKMNGYEVCKLLKAEKSTNDIPIIFISALNETFNKVKAFNAGAVDYITKPFEIEEVMARVKTHLKIHNLENQLKRINENLESLVKKQVQEITESKYAIIISLAKISESRDDDIGNHIERVKVYSRTLTEKLAMETKYHEYITPTYIENISFASLLHDIGKIGIEDKILKKPGRLTVEEFEEMKKHSTIGSDALEEIHKKYPQNKFIKMGIAISKYHHEKWDGTGYPGGIKESKIPLSARIMSIVDVYDALRSKRCYKEPFTHEYALAVIKEGRGINFDPIITDIFIKYADEFDKIFTEMS